MLRPNPDYIFTKVYDFNSFFRIPLLKNPYSLFQTQRLDGCIKNLEWNGMEWNGI